MASADNTRHLRYLLLFGEGGILILRAVLEREITKCGMTLDEILQTNEARFKDLIIKQLEKLFPTKGNAFRDTSTWDISLLCTVILKLFGRSLKYDERCSIRAIKDLRHELAHSASFSKDEQAYNDNRREVESILITLSNGLDRSVHNECQDLIQRCVTGTLDVQADTERVNQLSRYDEKFSEQFRILTEEVEGISGRVQNVEEKVECISERLKEQGDLTLLLRNMVLENADFHVFQVLGTIMDLKGPDAHLTNLGNEAILKVFKIALKRTGDGDNISALEREVTNILDEIERFDGVKVREAESMCVRISMRCEICSGLLELLEYLQGDTFRKHLLKLVLAVEEMFKGVFKICFEVERESLKKILQSLQDRTLYRRKVKGADYNPNEQSATTVQETGTLKPDDDTEIELQRENETLLDEILETCEYIHEEDANHVILLLGSIGVGKSSFINTLHKVLTGKYFFIAKQGRGVTQSVTGELIRYDNCGTSFETLQRIPNIHRRQKITQIFKKLPQIIDFAGLGNVDTPELSEILELLIGGFLPTRTSVNALEQCQKDFGVGALKRVFPKADPHWRVSKIIFMHSCIDKLPDNLIACLKGVLNTTVDNTFYLKYKPDIFALTSKFDLTQDDSLHPMYASSEAVISLAEVKQSEKDLADKLNVSGRSFRWISITDGISENSKAVENIALKFLKQLLQPGSPRSQPPENVIGLTTFLELQARQMSRKLRWFLSQEIQLKMTPAVIVAISLCVVAVILAIWLSK